MESSARALLEALHARTRAVLDQQVRAVDGLSRKAERMTALGVTALAGTIALGAFALSHVATRVDSILVSLLIAAGCLMLLAIVMFVEAYVGILTRPVLDHGVSAATLARQAATQGQTLDDLMATSVMEGARAETRNAAMMERSTLQRRAGVHLLLLGATLDAIAFTYVLIGSMYA